MASTRRTDPSGSAQGGPYSYARVDSERGINQTINGSFPFLAQYTLDNDTITGRIRWRAGERWTLGWRALAYDAEEFARPIEWVDHTASVEYGFNSGFLARGEYRMVDYEETLLGFNDYEANILQFSTGFRWK